MATLMIYTVGLINNREGILERTRMVEAAAESPTEAIKKAWESPAGLAFMFVHCKVYPRKSAWVQSVRPSPILRPGKRRR